MNYVTCLRNFQKLKHWFIFNTWQYCYLWKVLFILFLPSQNFIWSANCTYNCTNYALHSESVKIHKNCLYWSVFSTDMYRKIIFNCLILLSYFCWSVKYMSRPSKFPQIFYDIQKAEEKYIFKDFYYWHLWKVQFQLSNSFLGFFMWSVNWSSHVFSHFLLIIKLLELSLWLQKFDFYCLYLFRFFCGV